VSTCTLFIDSINNHKVKINTNYMSSNNYDDGQFDCNYSSFDKSHFCVLLLVLVIVIIIMI